MNLLHCDVMSVLWGNTDVYYSFDLTTRSPSLWVAKYSPYQEFLHGKISDLRDKGWTFNQIADWLNENGYSTVRGKTFRGNHVHSIVKKKRIRDERLGQRHEPHLSNFGLQFVDRTLINSN